MSADKPGAGGKLRVVITGAGSGFGAAMAHVFAERGYSVAVTDAQLERAETVARELRDKGATALASCLDVTRDEDWARFSDDLIQQWGGLDVLVNNAGVAASGLCEETSLEDWQWVMDIDLMGVVRGCHRFLPVLRAEAAKGRPVSIINIASFAGFSAMPGITAYGTAKAAVISFSEHLRGEVHKAGIGVTVVCPAFVATNLLEGFRTADPSHSAKVKRWMENSGVTAEDVATMAVNAMEKKQFLVLTHKSTLWAWRLKRWWPERYFRMITRQTTLTRRKAS